ncbi:MAG TPA: hypothetical protein VFK24_00255 [Gammaproteobacteria bacterium]|nr:hypothetical protein [Gammaproteobacteria bacterium]
MNDERLQQMVDALPQRIEPGHDLWPGIEARLGQPQRARPVLSGLAAAALVAACALGVIFGLNGPRPGAFTAATAAHSNAVVAQNIQIVDRAIVQVRDALHRDPTSPALQDLLLQAYAEKNRLTIQQTELKLTRSYTS